jgi:ADP-dependent NAD(P)H-hydrate dehydratase / NAD(P)H-hydrate epimerase
MHDTTASIGRVAWPIRVLPARDNALLFDTRQSRQMESRARARLEPGTLMRQAGLSVGRLVGARYPQARTVWIAAGPGGNGGDGLHAAAELAASGRTVAVTLLADASQLSADAAEGLRRCQQLGVEVRSIADGQPAFAPDVIVDGLLGLGASRAPQGPVAKVIERINRNGAPVISIDLPSGLAADSGASLGDTVVMATVTLSLLTLKPGLFTARGRAACGEIWFDDLGQTPAPEDRPRARLSGQTDFTDAVAPRQHDTHKGSFGDVLVVGGAPGMVGAARLAAHAAQAAGAGRTFVSLLDQQLAAGDVSRPEWLWPARAWTWERRQLAAMTVVCGCGGGDEVVQALPPLLEQAGNLVLDADALNAIARDPALETLLSDRVSRGQATVLTPHPLEAARLLGRNTAEIQADRLGAARSLSDRLNAVVVLKGSGTVTCAPGSLPIINSTGNAALASGGTGDVLAGWIGGLWAAHRDASARDPRLRETAFRCAAGSTWLHGQAADSWPAEAGRALDLVQAMRKLAATLTATTAN